MNIASFPIGISRSGAERKRRFNCNAIDVDLEVPTWQTVLVDTALLLGAGFSQGLIVLSPAMSAALAPTVRAIP